MHFSLLRSKLSLALLALLSFAGVFYASTYTSVQDLVGARAAVSNLWQRALGESTRERPKSAPRPAVADRGVLEPSTVGAVKRLHDPFARARLVNRCWRGYTYHRATLLRRWATARKLVGLKPAQSIERDAGNNTDARRRAECAGELRKRFRDRCATDFLPRFYSIHVGSHVRRARDPADRYSYVRVLKCGNRGIPRNLDSIYGTNSAHRVVPPYCNDHKVLRYRRSNAFNASRQAATVERNKMPNGDARANVTFTFVRDPITRFISAYGEIEWMYVHHKQYRRTVQRERMEWARLPRGSTERVRAFLHDILKCIPEGAGGITRHTFPQVGWMLPQKLDFVGDISKPSIGGSFERDWRALWTLMPPVPPASRAARSSVQFDYSGAPLYNRALGAHKSSRDPYGVTAAAYRLLAEEPNVVRALCHIFHHDFECLGFPKPAVCDGDD